MDFACKRFNLEDVIRCGLALSKTDYRILKFLVENGSRFDSRALADKLKIDLSTAQRSLKRLRERKLLIRSQVNLSSGGYNLFYVSIPRIEIHKLLQNTVDGWVRNVNSELASWFS
ncbi:MarR family transcriptional regulator [archaeon]|mgnify:CR=1 FL=1|jgi:predicted transcriptional regulator|nr:MarR family transcriptional regulator [archaeon]